SDGDITSTKKESKKSTQDYNQQKRFKRKISAIERSIEKLEDQIKEIHDKLIDPDFYNSQDAPPAMKKLGELETELEQKTQEWDELVSSMED
ncbi:MAG: hypothetical protein KJO29_11910, partial [Bacteroidia bacterium]|nr:hypothetical protein [Bacteroidia bacterium]